MLYHQIFSYQLQYCSMIDHPFHKITNVLHVLIDNWYRQQNKSIKKIDVSYYNQIVLNMSISSLFSFEHYFHYFSSDLHLSQICLMALEYHLNNMADFRAQILSLKELKLSWNYSLTSPSPQRRVFSAFPLLLTKCPHSILRKSLQFIDYRIQDLTQLWRSHLPLRSMNVRCD